MHLRPTIPDDEGRAVPLVRFNTTHLPIPMGPLPRRVQKEIFSQAARNPYAGRGAVSWAVVILLGISPAVLTSLPFWVALALGPRRVASGWTYAAIVAMVPVTWGFMWVLGPYTLSRLQRRDAARAAVERGFCASCGYQLFDLHQQAGLVRCPECGAAWARPHPAV